MSVKNARGSILPLTNNKDYNVRAEGLNALSAAINTSRSAGADGTRKNSAGLNERNIILYIRIMPPVELNRNRLYKYFNPKNEVRLFYKNDIVDVYIDGTIETFNCEPFTFGEVAQISILCHDPYFHAAKTKTYSFQYVTPLFEFPFDIAAAGTSFSEITKITTMKIEHGDVESGVIIEFTALENQILNPAFYNKTTQEHMTINFDMLKGDLIRINTNKGRKSIKLIRDGTETNILNNIAAGSSWIKLIAGDNELSYGADEGGTNLEVSVTPEIKYMGV
jgi:hypothetical protein